jgi:hypothetical protein
MLAIERQEQIVSQIRRNGAVRIHELTKQFSVSVETIRRDLLELERQDCLHRVHGGAVGIAVAKQYHRLEERTEENPQKKEELSGYDFWGHCDIDLVWGNIRKFYTDEVLGQYEKVGFNGHSNLYKNTPEVCARYRTHIEGKMYYRDVYSVDKGFAFDEPGMDDIYEALQIPVYKKIDFANLLKYDYGFFLDWGKEEDAYKNEHQVFTWRNGTLLRHYLDHGKIKDEEYMYLHYWCRPTTFAIKEYDEQKDYLIYADTTTDKPFELTPGLILKRSRRSKVKYYAKVLWFNRKKITWERIVFNVKGMLNYKK